MRALLTPPLANVRVQWARMNVLYEHRLPSFERRADLGVAIEVQLEILDERVLERRRHHADSVARTGENDRAPREIQRAGHSPRQHVIDLIRREISRDLAKDVDELASAFRFRSCARELFFGRAQRLVGGSKNGAHSELRLNAREQLADAKWFSNEVRCPETECLYRRLFRRQRRDHEHGHVTPSDVVLDALEELEAIHIREHDVEEQQVRRAL